MCSVYSPEVRNRCHLPIDEFFVQRVSALLSSSIILLYPKWYGIYEKLFLLVFATARRLDGRLLACSSSYWLDFGSLRLDRRRVQVYSTTTKMAKIIWFWSEKIEPRYFFGASVLCSAARIGRMNALWIPVVSECTEETN